MATVLRPIALLLLLASLVGAKGKMLLSGDMPGRSFQGPLPAASASQQKLALDLKSDVVHMAQTIGERNSTTRYPQLQQTRDWLRQQLSGAGYRVTSQDYPIGSRTFSNLECQLAGSSDQVLLVGAHYDSAQGCPAANDNGSGVASLLALARGCQQRGLRPKKTLRWVFFVNEEPPNFSHPTMGSLVYARHCRRRGDKMVAMLSLETLGYYSEAPHSQKYPAPLSLSYPNQGNFVAFVGNCQSGPLVQFCVGDFRKRTAFPSEGAALPADFKGVGWSDHWAFWEIGVPALMVTDTAPFRYPHYHRPSDTPDKLDYDRLSRVVEGLQAVIWDLANL